MSVIKINAITVPADAGDTLADRFAASSHGMKGVAGFEGFELLKPTDDRTTWLVITRWADDESFQAWRSSEAFGRSHGHDGGAGTGGSSGRVGVAPELWSYEVALTRP